MASHASQHHPGGQDGLPVGIARHPTDTLCHHCGFRPIVPTVCSCSSKLFDFTFWPMATSWYSTCAFGAVLPVRSFILNFVPFFWVVALIWVAPSASCDNQWQPFIGSAGHLAGQLTMHVVTRGNAGVSTGSYPGEERKVRLLEFKPWKSYWWR